MIQPLPVSASGGNSDIYDLTDGGAALDWYYFPNPAVDTGNNLTTYSGSGIWDGAVATESFQAPSQIPAGSAGAALGTFQHDYIEASYTGGTDAAGATGLSNSGVGMYVDTESVSSSGYGFQFTQTLNNAVLNSAGQETVNVLLTDYEVGAGGGYLTATLSNSGSAVATASNTGTGTAITGSFTNVYKNHFYGLLTLTIQGSAGEVLTLTETNGTSTHTVGVLGADVVSTAVPAPGTLMLFTAAGALLSLRRRAARAE